MVTPALPRPLDAGFDSRLFLPAFREPSTRLIYDLDRGCARRLGDHDEYLMLVTPTKRASNSHGLAKLPRAVITGSPGQAGR